MVFITIASANESSKIVGGSGGGASSGGRGLGRGFPINTHGCQVVASEAWTTV
jgi:hypothetical protein